MSIRGGHFVIDDSTISANVTGPGPVTNGVESIGRGIDIVVNQDAVIQNKAVLETNVVGNATPDARYGGVHVQADRIEIVGVLDPDLFPFTGISSNILLGSLGGNSGPIDLDANSILGKDIGQIQTITEGVGEAGNISLTADPQYRPEYGHHSITLDGCGGRYGQYSPYQYERKHFHHVLPCDLSGKH